jgi:hypothetical protein
MSNQIVIKPITGTVSKPKIQPQVKKENMKKKLNSEENVKMKSSNQLQSIVVINQTQTQFYNV